MPRFKMTREFFVPVEGKYASNVEKVVYDDYKVEVYTYLNAAGAPVMMMFGGKRSKPDYHYRYPTVEARDAAVAKYLEGYKKAAEADKARKAARKAKGRGLEVGDYLYASWGYDQTNVNFYKVVGLVGKTMVEIVPVASAVESSSWGSDNVIPTDHVKDYDVLLGSDYKDGKPARKVARDGSVTLESGYYYASKWDGTPKYETAAGFGH